MKKIFRNIIIFTLFLIAAVNSIAIESRYKNNLLNVELSQTPDNRVSVLLVFEKPYSEPVKVVYKTDNEYNILLPETYHSITSVNTLNALNIRSANVKLVPYFNQDNANGYTKISIKTTRPVIFNAHASYITTEIAQNELIDKIEKDEDFRITPTILSTTPVEKASTQQGKTKSSNINKTVQTKKTASTNVATKKQTKTKVATKQTTTIKSKTPEKVKTTQPINNVQVTKQPIQPTISKNIAVKPQDNTATNTIASSTNTLQIPNNVNEKVLIENTIATQKAQSTQIDNNIVIASIIGGILVLLLLLLRTFRRTTKKYTNLQGSTPDNYENIQTYNADIPQEYQNLSWQEKYKFMKEQEEAYVATQQAEEEENRITQLETIYAKDMPDIPIEYMDDTDTSDEFSPEVGIAANIEDLSNERIITNENDASANDPFGFNEPPINEGFEPATLRIEDNDLGDSIDLDNIDDISDIEPIIDEVYKSAPDKENLSDTIIEINENYTSNPMEPTLINQAKISKTKGFYLVRYENEVALMGYIKDQVFLIHSFKNEHQSFVQTRLTEKQKGADIYLVRSDNYKALVKVSKDEMKTLIKL